MQRSWDRTGIEPQAFKIKPELSDEEIYWLKSWRLISRERPLAMSGIAGIPLSAIERFLLFWPEWDAVFFAEMIIAIDDGWRIPILQKQERDRNK